ncbi:cell adhesion molecule 1-like [Sphaeramia orbicularis]|uniref:cell adhesion molecule 1-like n=1 Tax=Sphaeramia orbicularis TaxID=375764 RepID=UPI001180A350|nr:cell adhesion molecule 1-like [Sphaeramia orbicularis]
MYTVTSRLTFTVSREDDGVPLRCIIDHPAVKDFQAQKYLEVQYKPEVKIVVEFPQGLTREGREPGTDLSGQRKTRTSQS